VISSNTSLASIVDTAPPETFARSWSSPVCPTSIETAAFIDDGVLEVLADDLTRGLRPRMGTSAEEFYPQVHEQLRAFFTKVWIAVMPTSTHFPFDQRRFRSWRLNDTQDFR
jgi:hypothetical protein